MDTVPFTFCDAVVATLTKLPKPQYLWGAVPQTQGSIWDAAVQSHKEMRLSLTLCIGYDNGMFSYISGMKVQYLSFAELRNLPEKYTRITAVIITDMKYIPKGSYEGNISELLTFARRVINEANLVISIQDQETEAVNDCFPLLSVINFRNILFPTFPLPLQYNSFLDEQVHSECLERVAILHPSMWPRERLQILEKNMNKRDDRTYLSRCKEATRSNFEVRTAIRSNDRLTYHLFYLTIALNPDSKSVIDQNVRTLREELCLMSQPAPKKKLKME